MSSDPTFRFSLLDAQIPQTKTDFSQAVLPNDPSTQLAKHPPGMCSYLLLLQWNEPYAGTSDADNVMY